MKEETRECFDCEEVKSLTKEFFYRNGKDGFRRRCKECILSKRRFRDANKDYEKKAEYEISGYNGIDEIYC